MKKIISFILALFMFTEMFNMLTMNVSAAQATGINNNGVYNIINKKSGKYLNVHMGYDVNNTNVYQWTGDGSTEQKFKLVYDSSQDAYRIYAMCSSNGTNKVLDIVKSNGSVVSGSNVQIYNPVDNVAQLWKITKLSNGTYKIFPKSNTGVALTVYGTSNGTSSGTSSTSTGNVFLKTCGSSVTSDFQWTLEEVNYSTIYDRDYFASPTGGVGSRTQSYSSSHAGVDIGSGVSTNTKLYAIGDGVATFKYAYKAINGITYTTSWGNHVELQTPGKGMARYAHMSKFANNIEGSPYTNNYVGSVSGSTYKNVGSLNVSKGDYIGNVGTTGWSTGVHLHFEYLIDGSRVNPDEHVVLPGGPTSGNYPYITYQ